MADAGATLVKQSSVALFLRLCRLSLFSTLSFLTDWARPLLFNLFVSKNLKASDVTADRAPFEMDCISMAVMTFNIVACATAYGFNGSVDSYAPLAFGAGRPLELHLVLYRQLLLIAVLTVVLMLVLFNAGPLLHIIGVPLAMASHTGKILGSMAWSVPGYLLYDCLSHWAQSQQRQPLVTLCAAMGLGVNVMLNLLLGNPAAPFSAPIAALVAQNTLVPLLLAAGLFRVHRPPSVPLRTVFNGLPEQLGTSVAQMCWSCAELWAWQAQVFEARALGAGDAASYALLSSTYAFLMRVPIGACSGLTALVGEAIGAGVPRKAKELLGMGCLYGIMAVFAYALPLLLLRGEYAHLVSGGVPAVERTVTSVLPTILVMQLWDGLFNVLKAWLVVRQHQVFGAVQSLVVYYTVGLPAGWWLAFRQGLSVVGLWLGMGVAVALGLAASAAKVAVDLRRLGVDTGSCNGDAARDA